MAFKSGIELLDERGRLLEVGEFDNKLRAKFGLPAVEEKPDETKKILYKTKVKEIISKKKLGGID